MNRAGNLRKISLSAMSLFETLKNQVLFFDSSTIDQNGNGAQCIKLGNEQSGDVTVTTVTKEAVEVTNTWMITN
jgi:hypothetical protein